MPYFTIQIDELFTSYRFYHNLLPKLSRYVRNLDKDPILFDFSNTRRISSLVIPNLLCVGYIIKTNYQIPATIFVPDNSASDNIRNFLHNIGFVHLAKNYELFTFTDSIDFGNSRRILDPRCQTHEFNPNPNGKNDESAIRAEVSRRFSPFFRTLFSNFDPVAQYSEDIQEYRPLTNMVEDVCAQLIFNSIIHGRSFAFMTAEVNHTARKIYISIADCGIGFRQCINSQIKRSEQPFENRGELMSDELEAIINAVFVRAEDEHNKVYGIYPLIKRILDLDGIVRIHSIDTQLILTSKLRVKLDIATNNRNNVKEIRQSFLTLMRDETSNTYNVYTNMKCGGVHIEIELPLI